MYNNMNISAFYPHLNEAINCYRIINVVYINLPPENMNEHVEPY